MKTIPLIAALFVVLILILVLKCFNTDFDE